MQKNNNLLLISYNFYPNSIAGSLRFSHLSKYFEDNDYNVFVLTINKDKIVTKDNNLVNGGKIYRTGIYPSLPLAYNKSIVRKYRRLLVKYLPVDSQFGWVVPGFIKSMSIIKKEKIDKIIVTGPPFSSFLIAYLSSKIFNIKLIVDYRDPWFIWDNYSSFFRSSIRLKFVNFFLEKKILTHAWKIIFNTKATQKAYLETFPNIKKNSFVITNAYSENHGIKKEIIAKDKFVILYAGIFYGERKLSYLYNPIKRAFENNIIKREQLEIHVFGKVPEEDWILLNELSLNNLVIEHDRVEYQKIIAFMKGANILYLSQGYDHRHCVPYKLIDYLSVKRPILALTSKGSATNDLMDKVDCGEVADIESEESIYTALEKMIKDNSYSFTGTEKYTWKNVTDEYISLLKDI